VSARERARANERAREREQRERETERERMRERARERERERALEFAHCLVSGRCIGCCSTLKCVAVCCRVFRGENA